MTFKEKIRKILQYNKLEMTSVEDIALKTGIKTGTLYKAMTRKNGLSVKNTITLIDKIGLNPDWFETGNGEIFKENPTPVPEPAIKNPDVETRILSRIDKLTENVNSFGDFNKFLLDEVNRLRKKVTELGGEI